MSDASQTRSYNGYVRVGALGRRGAYRLVRAAFAGISLSCLLRLGARTMLWEELVVAKSSTHGAAYLVLARLAAARLSVAFREQTEQRLRNCPSTVTLR